MSFESWCEARQIAYQKKSEMELNGYQLIEALYAGDVEGITYFLTTDLNLEGMYTMPMRETNTLLWHAIYAYAEAWDLADHNTTSEMQCEHILYGIEQLIKKGANVNAQGDDVVHSWDATMISFAIARISSLELVTLLLQCPTIFDSDASMEYDSIMMMSLRGLRYAGQRRAEREVIAKWIAKDPRCNVSTCDHNRTSLVQLAVEQNEVEIAQLLLERGASIDHRDVWGNTALHLAVRDPHKECVVEFVRAGFQKDEAIMNVNVRYNLHEKHKNIDMVKLLLRYGASPTDIAPHMTNRESMDTYTYATRYEMEDVLLAIHEHEEKCERNALGCAMNPPEAGMSNLRRSIESIDSRLGSLACVLGWF